MLLVVNSVLVVNGRFRGLLLRLLVILLEGSKKCKGLILYESRFSSQVPRTVPIGGIPGVSSEVKSYRYIILDAKLRRGGMQTCTYATRYIPPFEIV